MGIQSKRALSQRQLEVMQILWESEKSMTANVIAAETGLNINTVQASLRSLTSKKYVKVGDIVYSGTVLARSYTPTISKEEYLRMSCEELMTADTRQLAAGIFISEITSIEVLDELERMIVQRRKELEDGR